MTAGIYVANPQYSGIDFAVGEVHGIRTWLVDDYGRLRARHASAAAPWRPGPNTAVCLSNHSSGGRAVHVIEDPEGKDRRVARVEPGPQSQARFGASAVLTNSASMLDFSITWHDKSTSVVPTLLTRCDPHEAIPDERCTCGFYAYTVPVADLRRASAVDGQVLGVIRGSGLTVIGTKGFRCARAEVLALLDPAVDAHDASYAAWLSQRLAAVYPDVPLLPSREALWAFAPIESALPAPSTDEFWDLP